MNIQNKKKAKITWTIIKRVQQTNTLGIYILLARRAEK